MKALDKFVGIFDEMMLKQAEKTQEFRPLLDKALWEIYKVDNAIEYHERQKAELEKKKKELINKMYPILESSGSLSHEVETKSFRYTIKPNNRHKVGVTSTRDFLKWLKANCEPKEVMEFFEGAFKKAHLEKFISNKVNDLIDAGKAPVIDGTDIGEVTFNRFSTKKKEKK